MLSFNVLWRVECCTTSQRAFLLAVLQNEGKSPEIRLQNCLWYMFVITGLGIFTVSNQTYPPCMSLIFHLHILLVFVCMPPALPTLYGQ